MRKFVISSILALATAFGAYSQNSYLIIPKGEIQIGAQAGHVSFKGEDSEYLLLLNPINANFSAGIFAPFCSYAYKDNRSIGLRFGYSEANAVVDDLTLDLLNDGLEFSLSNFAGNMRSYSASLYHRNYFGIDERGRFGVICELALGYGGSRSKLDNKPDSWSTSSKFKLSFSPGLAIFLMNSVSINATVSMADVSYNFVKCYNDGVLEGSRRKFGTRMGIDLLGINFGISVHI